MRRILEDLISESEVFVQPWRSEATGLGIGYRLQMWSCRGSIVGLQDAAYVGPTQARKRVISRLLASSPHRL